MPGAAIHTVRDMEHDASVAAKRSECPGAFDNPGTRANGRYVATK